MRRWPAALGLSLLVACSAPPPALEVGSATYTEEELLGLTPARRAELAELTALGLAVADGTADAVGRPLIERWRRERLAELLRAWRMLDSMGVGEDALRARYDIDPRVELTVRHLLVFSERYETDATRAAARAKAEAALARIRAGEPFERVAAEVSEEPGAESREGLLQPGREGSWVSEFWNAALALPVGGISPVVETQYGFHVLRLEDRQPVPFEEARNQVLLDVAAMVGAPDASTSGSDRPSGFALGAGPLADEVGDPTAAETDTVATWDGGALTLGALRDHLATLEPPRWRTISEGSSSELEQIAVEAAAALANERLAQETGLSVGETHEAELARRWTDTWSPWARTLGFAPGASVEAVEEAALAALSATGQNAALARDAVRARAPLLLRAYPIAGGAGAGGSPETTNGLRP